MALHHHSDSKGPRRTVLIMLDIEAIPLHLAWHEQSRFVRRVLRDRGAPERCLSGGLAERHRLQHASLQLQLQLEHHFHVTAKLFCTQPLLFG
jgi:hypothetical protein